MKNFLFIISLLSLSLFSASAAAIEFDEVQNFEDVFVISAHAPGRDRIEISWQIAPDYYLYNNKFLRFNVTSEGAVAGEPLLPQGDISFDDLLGEDVEKYHDRITVILPLVSVAPGLKAVELSVQSQGCLENVLCYPPTQQLLRVALPQDLAAANPLAGLLQDPLTDLALADPAQREPALQPDEAFVFEAIGYSAESILVRFSAQAGYYLYRDKFTFTLAGDDRFSISEVDLPGGVTKDDPEFGPVSVYYGQIEVPIQLIRPAGPAQDLVLEASFQGCRDGDICYPPMTRSVTFQMPAATEAVGADSQSDPGRSTSDRQTAMAPVGLPESDQDRLARKLVENPTQAMFWFFLAGLMLAFTPCVFPMVPILSGIIAGQGKQLTTAKAFWLSLVYVLAMAVTYTIAGVLAGLFGQNLQAAFQNPWILSFFVLIFILLALSMFGFYELQLPGRLQTRLAEMSNRQNGGHFWGVAVMGFLSALIVGPCVAPPLMAALIVIGASGDALLGGSALFAMSLGMGVPLIIFGVSAGKLVPRAGAWMEAVKSVFGVGLLAVAIWMLERILPGTVIMLLWGALAISCGVYLGALERIEAGASGWLRLWKSLGVVLLLVGALEIIGAAAGGEYWLKPLERLGGAAAPSAGVTQEEFRRIKTLEDLDQAIAGAVVNGEATILDFYADWCVECKRMEHNTFPEPAVRALLDRMQTLQADVTANDEDDQELMRSFGIIGPPAILFFDRQGEEMRAYRLVGYFAPDEFVAHLDKVMAAW